MSCENETALSPEDIATPLHIASIFIILIASSLGLAIPIISKYSKRFNVNHYFLILGKTIGTGVILCCSLVHLLVPGNESLTSPCLSEGWLSYEALAFVFALIGAFGMHLLEFVLRQFVEPGASEEQQTIKVGNDDQPTLKQEHESEHIHGAGGIMMSFSKDESRVQAYFMELAMTTHSVIIGLTLGVASPDELPTLVVALSFHQFFEGIALGSRFCDAQSLLRTEIFFLTAIFSLSTPIGIAIGMSAATMMDPASETFLLTQGILDSVCAGILLYIGFSLLVLDFTRDTSTYSKGWQATGLFLALWLGAGAMAGIGAVL